MSTTLEATPSYPSRQELIDFARQIESVFFQFQESVLEGCLEPSIKFDKSLVTQADILINQLVVDYFGQRFLDLDIIGEEISRRRPNASHTLVCDPVDGTTQFVNGIATANFIIAVLADRQPVCAVIYEPLHYLKPLWVAERGAGAYLYYGAAIERKLFVSHVANVSDGHLFTSHWTASKYNLAKFEAWCTAHGVSRQEAVAMGANGVRVAFGTAAAAVYAGTSGLEVAACSLLVEEAGGKATDIFGNPLLFSTDCLIDGCVISNGRIHDELILLLGQLLDSN